MISNIGKTLSLPASGCVLLIVEVDTRSSVSFIAMLLSMFQFVNYTWRSFSPRLLTLVVVFLLALAADVTAVGEVIWAVNCGGEAHVDVFGVQYQRDWLTVGHASSHGRSIGIRRVSQQDQILYQTERYHTSNFAYDMSIKNDGDYVLVMKFSEVWFTRANEKVNTVFVAVMF